ncbi:MAG: carbohydrate ABC transporter permease [Phycisphaerae bacterium]
MATAKQRLRSGRAPYLFVLPFIVTFSIFGLYPIVKSLYLAFFVTAGPTSKTFAGLGNFTFLLSDPIFWKAARNTAVFALASVCLQLPLSLFLAVLLHERALRGRNAFRLAIFAPRLVGMVFVGVLFSLIFNARNGLLNVALEYFFGLPRTIEWLNQSSLIMPALILTALWMYVGFNMIYFLAALQAVDQTLYEAAMVDGANAWQRFWHVTLPGIKPVAVFVVVLSTIGSFQLFELPYIMLGNGPGPDDAGLTIVMYLYQNGFISGDLGYASTIGWTLAIGVLLLSLVQMRLSGTLKRGGGQ